MREKKDDREKKSRQDVDEEDEGSKEKVNERDRHREEGKEVKVIETRVSSQVSQENCKEDKTMKK